MRKLRNILLGGERLPRIMLIKNVPNSGLFQLSLALLLMGMFSVLFGCDDRPTASLKVIVTFDGCTSEQTIALQANGEPVTTPTLLNGVNGETQSDLGCDIGELEYAFNTNPLIGKIELDVGEASEVTAFVPLDNKTKPLQPFVINMPEFQSIAVEVSFPNPNTVPLKGSVQVSN
jgi:hypothetical protein